MPGGPWEQAVVQPLCPSWQPLQRQPLVLLKQHALLSSGQ